MPRLLVPLLAFIATTAALLASSNSPCAPLCGNTLSSTEGERDIVCEDSAYTSTAGITFKGCTTCQFNSTYVDPVTQLSDLEAALYNVRFAVSYCLFGFGRQNTPTTPCVTDAACGLLVGAFDNSSLASNTSHLAYCSSIDHAHVLSCDACVEQTTESFLINNYISVIAGACSHRPPAGRPLNIEGSLFSLTQQPNVTDPAIVVSPYQQPVGLSLGAKVGITTSAVVVALFIAGFFIICTGYRKRRAFLTEKLREMEESEASTGFGRSKDHYAKIGIKNDRNWGPSGASETTVYNESPVARSKDEQLIIGPDPQSSIKSSQMKQWPEPLVTISQIESSSYSASSPSSRQAWSPYRDSISQFNSPTSGTELLSYRNTDWPLARDDTGIKRIPTNSLSNRLRQEAQRDSSSTTMDRWATDENERIELHDVSSVVTQYPQRPVSFGERW